MSVYTWTGISASTAMQIAQRRVAEQAATFLGATFPTDVAREASIAELLAAFNLYTPTELVTLQNSLRRFSLYQALGNPTFAIDTNFDVKNTEPIDYTNGGTLKQLADNTSFNTGTTKTITALKWGAAVLSVDATGTGVVTWASGAGYDSEALALAALTDPGATHTIMGYVAVLAGAALWTAGTDALEGGTGGTASTDTNYYNAVPPVLLPGAAIS